MNVDWQSVAQTLENWSQLSNIWLGEQNSSLKWIAKCIRTKEQPGLIIADEVGLGKTRLAVAAACAVQECGGRVAILVPPILMSQWVREFEEFVSQLKQANVDTHAFADAPIELRSYPDLFDSGKSPDKKSGFFLPQLALISHYFGVSSGLRSTSHAKRWLLPTLVKAALDRDFDGHNYRGLNQLKDDDDEQSVAVDWLEKHLTKRVHLKFANEVRRSDALKPSSGATIFKEKEPRKIFCRLIGELIGPADLIIVDEVHKSREGSDPTGVEGQSRLSECLNDILLSTANAASKNLKRIALSATPLELDAMQWSDILARVGLHPEIGVSMANSAKLFADTVRDFDSKIDGAFKKLESHAEKFQSDFQKYVTRRRWIDHSKIKQFVEHQNLEVNAIHPHRVASEVTVKICDLDEHGKWAAAASESLSLLARGGSVIKDKSFGARHSSGQNVQISINEALEKKSYESQFEEHSDKVKAARQKRRTFWQGLYVEALRKPHTVKELSVDDLLQWHPRILKTVRLVESLVKDGEKVLLFGEFNTPLRALTEALNIRRYLTELILQEPTLPPANISAAALEAWKRHSDFVALGDRFYDFAAQCERDYNKRREGIRTASRLVASNFVKNADDVESIELISDWLAVCLSESSEFDPAEFEVQCDKLIKSMEQDGSDLLGAEEVTESRKVRAHSKRVARLRAAILDDLGGAKSVTVRRSPYARFLYGDVKRPTRKTLQMLFNQPGRRPQVLVAQAAVASEGLNLHLACRKVVLFHLEWNPTKTEQQIGRVDRENSKWMRDFSEWKDRLGAIDEAPRIEIYTVSVEGSYDEHRNRIIKERKKAFDAQMFGKLVEEEIFSTLSDEAKQTLEKVAPNFRPPTE